MFWNNYSIFNPAASGLYNRHFASVDCNIIPDYVKNASLLYDFKLTPLHGGLGINYNYYQMGVISNYNINLNYAFQLELTKDRILSIGESFSLYTKGYWEGFEPEFRKYQTATVFDLNFGAAYKSEHWFVGLSSDKLIQSAYKKIHLKNKRQYYFLCSYDRSIGENFDIKPAFFLKSDFTYVQLDINFMATYKKRFWFGATYRINEAIAVMTGIDIRGKYRIGYSYGFNTSRKLYEPKSSHEITLTLMLD
jgi:type IX secretion system PorP/SprF family membrane protein